MDDKQRNILIIFTAVLVAFIVLAILPKGGRKQSKVAPVAKPAVVKVQKKVVVQPPQQGYSIPEQPASTAGQVSSPGQNQSTAQPAAMPNEAVIAAPAQQGQKAAGSQPSSASSQNAAGSGEATDNPMAVGIKSQGSGASMGQSSGGGGKRSSGGGSAGAVPSASQIEAGIKQAADLRNSSNEAIKKMDEASAAVRENAVAQAESAAGSTSTGAASTGNTGSTTGGSTGTQTVGAGTGTGSVSGDADNPLPDRTSHVNTPGSGTGASSDVRPY